MKHKVYVFVLNKETYIQFVLAKGCYIYFLFCEYIFEGKYIIAGFKKKPGIVHKIIDVFLKSIN